MEIFTSDELQYIKNENGELGIVDSTGNIVVPYGKYGWIDSFDRGLARVRTTGKISFMQRSIIVDLENNQYISDELEKKICVETDRKEHPEQYSKWGVINMKGEEVIPVIYDEIWNFKENNYPSIIAQQGEQKIKFLFKDLPGSSLYHKHRVSSFECSADEDRGYFDLSDCFDNEGYFDIERLEDAIMDGEYVPDEW